METPRDGPRVSDDAAAAPTAAVATSASESAAASAVAFDPAWVDDIVWFVERVSRHSLTNRWLVVDETPHFELVMKEKKAVTTAQCRILVKGANHLPLQLSCGGSVQFLYPTWQYLKLLEAHGTIPDVPKERYREVEEFMEMHIKKGFGAVPREQSLPNLSESPRSTSPVTSSAVFEGLAQSVTTPTAASQSRLTPVDMVDGNTNPKQVVGATTGVRDRLRGMWNTLKKSPAKGPSSGTPNISDAEREMPSSDAVTPPVAPRSMDGKAPLEPLSVAPKESGLRDFIKRKLNRGPQPAKQQQDFENSSSDDEDGAVDDPSAPPCLVACESLADFRLSWINIRRMFNEARKRTDDGHIHHETFDRLYRRRRAVNKWQYQNREVIFEQIKANRTVTIMTVVGVYTLVMHFVPFDVFCLLLLALEIAMHHLCTYYRDIAMTMGRRAAKTRVDRVKDWFYFGVTRRKTRDGDAHLNEAPASVEE